MSWRDGAAIAHLTATSQAGRQADHSHEVRHAAGRRHRLQIQRLQAGRVTPCTQTSRSAEGAARPASRPNRAAYQAVDLAGGLAVHGRLANEIALPTMQGWFALRKLRPTTASRWSKPAIAGARALCGHAISRRCRHLRTWRSGCDWFRDVSR